MMRRSARPLRQTALVALVLAGCAGGPSVIDIDDSVGAIELVLLGDGNLLVDGEAQQFEAAVVLLEQRAAAMSAKERDGFVVKLRAAPANASREVADRIGVDRETLLDRLSAMDLKQIVLKVK